MARTRHSSGCIRSILAALLLLAFAHPAATIADPPLIISTIAGGGPDHVLATGASIGSPWTVAAGADGSLYIVVPDIDRFFAGCPIAAGFDRVYKVDPAGRLAPFAGTGAAGFSGDGGPALGASLGGPQGIAVDGAGNVLIADTLNNRVRRVDALTGIITTVVGNGSSTFSGDGGPASSAGVGSPNGLAVDAAGNLYIADAINRRVRRVDAATGLIGTVAGSGTNGFGGDGGPAVAAAMSSPRGLAIDAQGNLFIADQFNHRIRRVDAVTGIIDTVAGTGVSGYGGDGDQADRAMLRYPWGVALDGAGNLYIGDYLNGRVRRVDASTNVITTLAGNGTFGSPGDGGPATAAYLIAPRGLALDPAGALYIADSSASRVRRVDLGTGIITTAAGNGNFGFSGDGGPATDAVFDGLASLVVEGPGSLLVMDAWNLRVRRIDLSAGTVQTVVGNGTYGYGGDGGPATAAAFRVPRGIALDAAGNMLIADKDDHRIRRVDAVTGVITTWAGDGTSVSDGDGGPVAAARVFYPVAAAVDSSGNVFIAETLDCEFGGGNRVRRVDASTGIITAVAGSGAIGFSGDGGPATAAALAAPNSIVIGAGGDLYIADSENHRIRRVSAATGIITTIAGNGTPGYGGDGGLAVNASLRLPASIALDSSGGLLIADAYNHRVRRVNLATGIISTVAGSFSRGFAGDTGDATLASLNVPYGVAVGPAGDIFVMDGANNRVRRLSTEPVPGGAVPDDDSGGATPLTLVPAPAGALTLSWGPSCAQGDTDYAVYEGALGDFTSHVPRLCSTGGARAVSLLPPPGDVYYLVVPQNHLVEGSYGARSDGTERPASAGFCRPRLTGSCR